MSMPTVVVKSIERNSQAESQNVDDFIFSWEPLVRAHFDYVLSDKRNQKEKLRLLLSRVYIDDHDLLNRAKREDRYGPCVTNAPAKMKKFSKQLFELGYHSDFDLLINRGSFGQLYWTKFVTDSSPKAFFKEKGKSAAKFWTDDLCADFSTMSDISKMDFGYHSGRDHTLVAANANIHFCHMQGFYKYWVQRFRFFSKFREGKILMNYADWLSAIPENFAIHFANRVRMVNIQTAGKKDWVVVDAFARVGTNAIQLALAGAYVIAMDSDPVKLRCARQNAKVYGVADRIDFICGDFVDLAQSFKSRSPSWGGKLYNKEALLDVNWGVQPNVGKLYHLAKLLSPNFAFFLPPNTNIQQLTALAATDAVVLRFGCGSMNHFFEIEQVMLNKKVRALHVYFGNLAAKDEDALEIALIDDDDE